jgi:hypothetical protein
MMCSEKIFREIKRISAGKKFKICMLTKATAATQAQDPKLRQKFGELGYKDMKCWRRYIDMQL